MDLKLLSAVIDQFGCFFFFSSRRRHTRCLSDWSSDVCSSDLDPRPGDRGCAPIGPAPRPPRARGPGARDSTDGRGRSEERRVGKECRYRRVAEHEEKNRVKVEMTNYTVGEEAECAEARTDQRK